MSNLGKAIKAELLGHTATQSFLAGDTGQFDRVFPGVIPQKKVNGPPQHPCVTYTQSNVDRQVLSCGTDGTVETLMQLDCVALRYDEAHELADAVRGVLLDFRGMLGGIVRVRAASLSSESDLSDIEPGLYRVTQTWAIWHRE